MANPFGPLYSINFVALVVCAVIWFKFAQLEKSPPWVWAGLSSFVFAFMWLRLGWGIIACVLGQVVVVAAITGYRLIRDFRDRD